MEKMKTLEPYYSRNRLQEYDEFKIELYHILDETKGNEVVRN